MNFDELYNEKIDGQIIIRRNQLNQKFEFLLFIETANMLDDKFELSLELSKKMDELNHPNILNLNCDHELMAYGNQRHIVF